MAASTGTTTGISAAHPAVAAYAARHHLDPSAFRSDGRLTLRFDEHYRVHLRRGPDGRIAITSRLLDLSERSATQADQALERLAALGAGLLREQAAGLCIDAADNSLQLQQLVPADVDAQRLEDQLAEYVNALAFWTKACASEAGLHA